jgi:hypothetical protein
MDWEEKHADEQADGYADNIMLTLYALDRMKVTPLLIISFRSVHFDCIK